jgi:hypothetical protein
MSEKNYLFHESKFPKEEFFLCDAKALKNFYGNAIIARSMKFLLEGNKTQKHQVMMNIRYWVKFNNMQKYVSNTLPFIISCLVLEENISLDAVKTIHHITNKYSFYFNEDTKTIIRENVKKYEGNENISNIVNWIINPFHFGSTVKIYQKDLIEIEKDVRGHSAFNPSIPKKYQFKAAKYSHLKNYNGGCVYLIREMEQGRIKIGKSKNVVKRLKHFGIALPFQIEEVHFIATKNYDELEQHLHKKYAYKRVNGEWFDLDENDIEEIKKIKSDSDWIISEQLTFFQ